MYWIVRAKWEGKYDQTDRFIKENIWQNIYDYKFIVGELRNLT